MRGMNCGCPCRAWPYDGTKAQQGLETHSWMHGGQAMKQGADVLMCHGDTPMAWLRQTLPSFWASSMDAPS